jgi:hypothetical protein
MIERCGEDDQACMDLAMETLLIALKDCEPDEPEPPVEPTCE